MRVYVIARGRIGRGIENARSKVRSPKRGRETAAAWKTERKCSSSLAKENFLTRSELKVIDISLVTHIATYCHIYLVLYRERSSRNRVCRSGKSCFASYKMLSRHSK